MRTSGPVEFAVLGSLEFAIDGRRVKLGGATPRTLLVMLLLRLNQPIRSDALIAGLWGERVPASATNSLHSHISRLRRILTHPHEDVRIERVPGGYSLAADPDRLDAHRFECLMAQGLDRAEEGFAAAGASLLREALGLWRGPALGEFAEAEFARGEAVRLDGLRLEAQASVVDIELGLGAHGRLVAELEQLVVDHPMQERFWGQLMVALYREGRQADALGAYRRARAILQDELGVEPGPAVRRIEELILRQSPELDAPIRHAPVSAVATPQRTPWGAQAFVGRDDELATLAEALTLARLGAGQLVVVESAAGIGKTALVERFASALARERVPVLFGRAWEDVAGPPFWPWIEVLQAARAAHSGEPLHPATVDLIDLLPEWDGRFRNPEQARASLFQSVAHRLYTTDGSTPTVIVLEDLHGADESSLQLLRFLLRDLRSASCLLIVTHRPVGPGEPLAGALDGAARRLEVKRLTLAPLTDAEVRMYLEHSLSAESLSSELIAAAVSRAEGHTLFLTEIVRMLRSREHDGHRLSAADATEIPRNVSEMIGRRFTALASETLRVLLAASVIGREFDLRLLGQVTALDLDSLLDRVEEAAEAGLVNDLSDGRLGYRFDHALTEQILYSRLPGPRRVVVHARIADAIAAGVVGTPKLHLPELAHHRCASVAEGGLAAAVDAAVEAAEAAAAQMAHEEASRLYQLALHTHALHEGDDERAAALLVAAGHARGRAGQPEPARALFLRAAEMARARGDSDALAVAALGLGAAFEGRVYDLALVELLDEALAALPSASTPLRARLLARLSMALNLKDPEGRADELSRSALTAARDFRDPALEAHCLSARYMALAGPEQSPERVRCASETLRLAEALDDRELALDGLTWMVCELFEHPDRPALDARLAQHAQLAETVRHPLHAYYVLMWRSTMATVDGRAAAAIELANQAASAGEALTEMAYPRRLAASVIPYRYLGRLADLVSEVDGVSSGLPFLSTWRAGHAMVHLELGDPDPAERLLKELPEDVGMAFHRDGNWTNGLVMLTEIVVALGDARRAHRLRELLTPASGRMGFVRFGVASAGPVDRALALLAQAVGDEDAAERHFELAMTVTESFGHRPFHAHTQCDYGRMLLRRDLAGDARKAEDLVQSAAATADQLALPGLQGLCKDVGALLQARKREVPR